MKKLITLFTVLINTQQTFAQPMNTTNEALITQFYTAFAQRNAEVMASCYTNDVVFTDPAFGV